MSSMYPGMYDQLKVPKGKALMGEWAEYISVPELVEFLCHVTILYHYKKPIIDDDTFDKLEEILRLRDPTNEYFNETGALDEPRPGPRGDKNVISREKVKLPIHFRKFG